MTRGQSWLFLGVRRSPARSRAPCRARCAVVKRIARARSFLKVITARLSWDLAAQSILWDNDYSASCPRAAPSG
jgi:hypothetical protein